MLSDKLSAFSKNRQVSKKTWIQKFVQPKCVIIGKNEMWNWV